MPYEKVGKNEPVCIADEITFDIPDSWEWVRLNEAVLYTTDYVANGSFATLRENVKNYKTENYALLVKTQDFSNNFTRNLTYIDKQGYEFLAKSKLYGGELMLSNIGASIGKAFIIPKLDKPMSLAPNSIIVKCINDTMTQFVKYLILSPFGQDILKNFTAGTAMPKFSKTQLRGTLIPLPPLKEQQRIVDKLKELEPYINDYDKAYEKIEKLNTDFPDLLKKSILQEAVQGKLVPQDQTDEPASVLIEQIRQEKEQLIKDKKIKKDKNESFIFRRDNSHYEKIGSEERCIDDEIPFDIPDSWEWTRLKSICIVNPRNQAEDDIDAGFIPMTLINDGYTGGHMYETKKWKQIKSGFTHFATGDLVLAKITPCFQNRKSTIISELPNNIGAGTTELHVIRNYPNSKLNLKYLLLLVKTADFISAGVKAFTGTAGQQRVGKTFVEEYLVPLPPLNEQQRIVDKVNQLLPQISKL